MPTSVALLLAMHPGPWGPCTVDAQGLAQCDGLGEHRLPDTARLAVDEAHGCALDTAGAVWCWGANASGQAGIEGPRRVPEPTRLDWLADGGPVTALSTGVGFGCATQRKATTCWGDLRTEPEPPPPPSHGRGGGGMGMGMIGYGRPVERPVTVDRIDAPKGLVQHDGGAGFACGVRAEGSVVCWGEIPNDPWHYGVVEQPLRDAVEVAVGDHHACARTDDGAVWCWRDNEDGQLGDGRPDDQASPVRVVDLPPATAVVAGDAHSCALDADGGVWCWGTRRHGALGDGGRHGEVRRPQRVALPPIRALEASGGATCAVPRGEGEALCWGYGGIAPRRTEQRVVTVPLDDVVQATAGEGHTCARTDDDTLWCWGDGDRLGVGLRPSSGVPQRVADRIVDVAAGNRHTCAVGADASVTCWGDREFGQLDGYGDGVATPQRVAGPALTQIAAGSHATCGRDDAGTAWCWGEGGARLGARRDDRADAPVPVHALGPGQLLVGRHHTATVHDGRVEAIGSPWDGAFGVPHEDDARRPVRAPIEGLHHAAVAGSATCGLREDHSLWCFGDGRDESVGPRQVLPFATAFAHGAYGRGCAVVDAAGHVDCWGDMGPPFGDDAEAGPVRLEGVQGVVQLVMGEDHTCGRHDDGAVTCWGRWRGGQGYARPWAARQATRLPIDGVDQLVAGSNHTCARTQGGHVWCWGASAEGQVGDGGRTRRATPVQLELAGIRELAAGGDHTCARADEATWCWGDDSFGQLGRGVAQDLLWPTRVPFVDGVATVAAGWMTTCATGQDGTTTCWGRDMHRDVYSFEGAQPFELPLGGRRDLTLGGAGVACALGPDRATCWGDPEEGGLGPDAPDGADARTGGLRGAITQIALGDGHGCALQADGQVVCFGANRSGQAGAPEADTVARHEVLTDAVAIAAGKAHTCAVGRDGRVRCWGANDRGQLGHDGDGGPTPVQVDGVEAAVDVIAGWQHSCARTEGGALSCWGADFAGQLGAGDVREAWTPRPVPR